jgi:hypothetical protein
LTSVVADRLIHVGRGAHVVGAAAAERDRVRGVHVGRLAHLVDRAASGAASGERRRRPLRHLHLLQVEGIASVTAEVAHAVDEHIGARAEPADGQIVAGRHAAFTCLHGDADHVPQHVAERRRRLLLDDVAANHVDRLRHLTQRLGELRRRQPRHGAAGDLDELRHAADVDRDRVVTGKGGANRRAHEQLVHRFFRREPAGNA